MGYIMPPFGPCGPGAPGNYYYCCYYMPPFSFTVTLTYIGLNYAKKSAGAGNTGISKCSIWSLNPPQNGPKVYPQNLCTNGVPSSDP